MAVETGLEGRDFDRAADNELLLDLDGYAGPIDILLELARDQKVDLTQISILQLADQYLAFISRARSLRLELAADYLVMAAWLAYLKSRLLLPLSEQDPDQPNGAELAAALRFQLQRLEAIREVSTRLMGRPQLGVDVFPHGAPGGITLVSSTAIEVSLYELLKAYADHRRRRVGPALRIAPEDLHSVDEALERLRDMIGRLPDWQTLNKFLPPGIVDGLAMRSALASTLAASLELARTGQVELRQASTFGPVYLRKKQRGG